MTQSSELMTNRLAAAIIVALSLATPAVATDYVSPTHVFSLGDIIGANL